MNKQVSYVLMIAGTVGASITAARTLPNEPGWESTWQINTGFFVFSLAVLTVGVMISRIKDKPLLDVDSETQEDSSIPDRFLLDAKSELQSLFQQSGELSTHELYQKLGTIMQNHLQPFEENRQHIIDKYGMGKYALVMTPFAEAERYLNRAWSAAVDEHKEESVTYIERAVPSLQEAYEEMDKLQQDSSRGQSQTAYTVHP